MILYKYSFDTYKEFSIIKIWLEDNGMVQAIRIESIIIEIFVKDQIKRITLKEVLRVPKMKKKTFFQ